MGGVRRRVVKGEDERRRGSKFERDSHSERSWGESQRQVSNRENRRKGIMGEGERERVRGRWSKIEGQNESTRGRRSDDIGERVRGQSRGSRKEGQRM